MIRAQRRLGGIPAADRAAAVALIRAALDGTEGLRAQIAADPDWWRALHQSAFGGLVCNLLRAHGFDEERWGVNLDNVWAPLVELAVEPE